MRTDTKKITGDEAAVRKELVNLTVELVRFPTMRGHPASFDQCMARIKKFFADAGLAIFVREHVSGGHVSLVITRRKTRCPTVFLVGHIDVVDAPAQAFRPKVRGGKLFGRGTLDMKSGLVAAMVAFREVLKRDPGANIGLMIVSDEEAGGFHGVGYLLEKEKYRCLFAILTEGGVEERITHRQKGVCQLKVSVQGVSAHGAYPWLGKNAAGKLIEILAKIEREFPRPCDAWIPTMTLSKIEVPNDALNRSPSLAHAFLDIRFTEDFARRPEDVMTRLQRAAPEATFELLMGARLFNTDPRNLSVKRLQRLAHEVYGRPLKLAFSHGASDGRFFGQRGIPCIEFGPVGKGHHGNDEYVTIESMILTCQILKRFLADSEGDHQARGSNIRKT